MSNYKAPGVYVEEIPSAQQPIAGVGTNTAAFIGIIPDEIQYPELNEAYTPPPPPPTQEDTEAKQKRIKSLDKQIDDSRDEIKELNKDKTANKDKIEAINEKIKTDQKELNGLKASLSPVNKTNNEPFIILKPFSVEVEPCVTKLCTNFTEYTKRFGTFSADVSNKDFGTHRALTNAVYGFFKNGGTRCFVTRIRNEAEIRKALEAIDSIDEVSLVAAPGLIGSNWNELTSHCKNAKDRFAILDCPEDVVGPDGDLDQESLTYGDKSKLPQRDKNAAFYFPYIEVVDPAKQLQDMDPALNIASKYRGRVCVPPSGHIAGIYARTDEERGVHKAPANTAIAGALNVQHYISHRKQMGLNPQGVNCIRNLNGNIVVYGARTIGGDMNGEWKYVNVRRVMLYLEESIDEGTQWVVFEPNDMALWGKIRRNVGAFLTNVWRSGALFGATPEEAFYVKCDAELNPPEVRDLGQVVIEIGVSIVRPAEFVIFRISQSSDGFSA